MLICDGMLQAKYLVQDSLYLKEFSKVLALIAAKSDDRSVIGAMAKASHTVRLTDFSRQVVCGPKTLTHRCA